MNGISKALAGLLIGFCCIQNINIAYASNQTNTLSPILPESGLPFRITIEQENFSLPQGIHSGVFGVYKGLWVFIAGSTIGLHGFGPDPFPAAAQNTTIYVVNPRTGQTSSRSLNDPSSGLNSQQIDSLSTISPQGYQENNTLYMTGGYGVDTAAASFGTKSLLTAIYLPGIIQWVTEPGNKNHSVVKNIKQLYNPIFQIAGGEMLKVGQLTQLIFGQNFAGVYTGGSNGIYSEQVRLFRITDANGQLSVDVHESKPFNPDPNYRRRDLNITPVILNKNNHLQYGSVAYSGVFTADQVTPGIWTVPVVIDDQGTPTMADPNLPSTLKQGMNNYASASAGLYSKKYTSMYNIFFGGISFGFYASGVFQTDPEIPFINQVTTVQIDKNGAFTQYLMDSEYPTIPSTTANPGNPLLFGAGAYFIPGTVLRYPNSVINLDSIRKPTIIGYIVGGIASTLPNTNDPFTDSFASTYIFKVTLIPTK